MTAAAPSVPSVQHRVSEDQVYETTLLERIAQKDREAFHEFHERFGGLVHATVYKVLSNSQDTEEVAQEIFSQVWMKAHLYSRERGKPMTWIATMARNRAIDRFRSKRRRYRLHDDYELEARSHDSMTRTDASDETYTNETATIVRSAVMELSKEQREAIELAFFSGMTQNEIASRLGQPLGTVKARIRRGMLKLRGKVAPRL